MKFTRVRYWLLWVIVIAMLAILPKAIYLPLKGYWYQRKGLTLCTSGVLPTVYTDAKAVLAIPELKESLQLYFPSWEAHFLLGMAYAQLKDFAKAEEAYCLSLRFNPNYAKSHYNLGNVYYHMGRYDQAIEHYLGCLKIDSTCTAAQRNLIAAKQMRSRKRGLAPF